jgi:DNA-directed RNA polymerase specialized sigma24 family protein
MVRTWILQFAYFKALVRRRYLRIRNFYKQEELQQADEFGISVAHGDVFGMNENEWRHFIEGGLAELTKPQRRAIELIHIEGLTLAETSEALRETLATEKSNDQQTVERLSSELASASDARNQLDMQLLDAHARTEQLRRRIAELDSALGTTVQPWTTPARIAGH